nr:unnamed protein product [Spirometra erinaceieuropaei]
MLLVKAGKPVDDFIELLLPLLEQGDIVIDGGNSEFADTERRCKYLEEKGLLYVGSGVSGGEEGARYGPSLMPGGNPKAWPRIKTIFQSIAAKAPDGEPCCDWAGSGGAGHFVKMVHNGIEYGDMQLISEAYHLLRSYLNLSVDEISKVFDEWNKGELESYLIAITRDILSFKDSKGVITVDQIRDVSGQALYASKIVSYAQGFMLLQKAREEFGWDLNLGAIALMWRGGCIIRSRFLGDIKAAFTKNPNLTNLLLDPFFKGIIERCQCSWRTVVCKGVGAGIPMPGFSSALAFYDAIRSARLPANLIQAQRDYFGAHQYELESAPGTWYHTDWTGHGGNTTSSTYQV